MTHITGIGGVFVKSRDNARLLAWYRDVLGIRTEEYGANFLFREHDEPESEGYAVWGAFKHDTDYFAPSDKDFMINFRVRHLDGLLKKLKQAGVKQIGQVVDEPYGRFAWILDPEGTKIELWEQKGPPPEIP